MENALWEPLEKEFEGADLGDERLVQRLMLMVSALERRPESSLAKVSRTVAEREAAYRFVENPRVTIKALLAPHREATVRRCRDAGAVYVVSDTTEFDFEGRVRGRKLGRLQGKRRGFFGHTALAVSADGNRRPLGVLGINPIVRSDAPVTHRNKRQKQGAARESSKWGDMVKEVDGVLSGIKAIHVMDSEADIYELLSEMTLHRREFVIRAGRDRLLLGGEEKLFSALTGAPVLLEREVKLSARPRSRSVGKGRRNNRARPSRSARLAVSSHVLTIRRPKLLSDPCYLESLQLNIVHVLETAPPEGQLPVEWVLVTSEPVQTAEQVAAVVDAYRARWIIEEYFKALKTGCAYESRGLRSVRTLTNMLGLLAVIAWRLLLLRTFERTAPLTPASKVIDPVLLEALAARLRDIKEPKPLPPHPTVADVMRGVARLGGHHRSNGPPGWQLLWYGFQDWLMWAAGFIAGRSATYCDHS